MNVFKDEYIHIMTQINILFRGFRRAPLFSIVVVLTLALGLGAVGLAGAALNRVLLNPLSFDAPERLVTVYSNVGIMGSYGLGVSPPLYLDLNDSYEGAQFGALFLERQNLETDNPVRVSVAQATPSVFEVLRVSPQRGTGFSDTEGVAEVLLSDAFWRSNYASDPEVVGASLSLDGIPHRIAGVMPVGFIFPTGEVDVWSRLDIPRSVMDNRMLRGDHRLTVIGRVDSDDALRDLDRATENFNDWINSTVSVYSPETDFSVEVASLADEMTEGTRPAVLLLSFAAAGVLLIVIANVANLIMFRTRLRNTEFAVRMALGAERSRILGQLVAESAMLTITGGILALPVIAASLAWIMANATDFVPGSVALGVDVTTVVAVLLIALTVGLLLGGISFKQVRASSEMGIGSERGSTSSRGTRVFSNSLVVTQVALSFLLLAGSGFLFQGYRSLRAVDAGMNPEQLTAITFALPEVRYDNMQKIVGLTSQMIERTSAIPGVTSASVIDFLPLRGIGEEVPFWVEQRVEGVDPITADIQFAGDQYFETAGIAITSGRGFLSTDVDGSLPVAVLNRTAADQHFGGDAVGERIEIFQDDVRQIIGVVEDVHFRSLEVEPRPQVYLPLAQYPPGPLWRGDLMRLIRELTVVVRGGVETSSVAGAVRRTLDDLDPLIPVSSVTTMPEVVRASVSSRATLLSVIATFASGALILGVIGVYSVLAYAVSQRRREIGIRISLGADTAEVMKAVALPSLLLVIGGVGIGLAGTFAGKGVLGYLVSAPSAFDPLVLSVSGLVVLAAGAAASALPARRASRVDPVEVLRDE